jgi:hypothetical protein
LDQLLVPPDAGHDETVRHRKAVGLDGSTDRFTRQILRPMKPKVIHAVAAADD